MEKELKEALLHFQTIMKEKQVDKEQLKSYKQTIDMLQEENEKLKQDDPTKSFMKGYDSQRIIQIAEEKDNKLKQVTA